MRTALVIVPESARRAVGPAAVWITCAGWAKAAERRFGSAIVVSPDGEFGPTEALRFATERRRGSGPGPTRRMPTTLVTLVKDGRSLRDGVRLARVARVTAERIRADRPPWVWQQHNLFQYAGRVAARSLGVPLVVFVDAPIVWQARRWGVRRPVWGRLLERFVEGPYLRKADLVLAVSDQVAAAVCDLGVDRTRVLVTPCAVDLERFAGDLQPVSIPGFEPDFQGITLVWIGSFRRFHGLEVLLEALDGIPRGSVRLVLAGDGNDRARVMALAESSEVDITFAGSLTSEEVPRLLVNADVGVVTSRGNGEFHYSPLKLREYLAAGLPVVAPAEPDIQATVTHGETALLYEPGQSASLREQLVAVVADPDLRARLSEAARELARTSLSWEVQLDRMSAALDER